MVVVDYPFRFELSRLLILIVLLLFMVRVISAVWSNADLIMVMMMIMMIKTRSIRCLSNLSSSLSVSLLSVRFRTSFFSLSLFFAVLSDRLPSFFSQPTTQSQLIHPFPVFSQLSLVFLSISLSFSVCILVGLIVIFIRANNNKNSNHPAEPVTAEERNW